MGKPDYAKARALAKQFLECIGDEPEGESPSLPKVDADVGGAGEEKNTTFLKTTGDQMAKEDVVGSGTEGDLDPEKKKKQMAMFSATLASKYGK
jgi:hypothetical protein